MHKYIGVKRKNKYDGAYQTGESKTITRIGP